MATIQSIVAPGETLGSQEWWPDLHRTINASYHASGDTPFPPGWTRLPANSEDAAESLTRELGPNGYMAVLFVDQLPVACSGVCPYQGKKDNDDMQGQVRPKFTDLNIETQRDPGDEFPCWEVLCFCVHPDHRNRRLGGRLIETVVELIRSRGAKRLLSNWIIEETGKYWPKMGFETIPDCGSIFAKGWTHRPGQEGLLTDIHLIWGVKEIA